MSLRKEKNEMEIIDLCIIIVLIATLFIWLRIFSICIDERIRYETINNMYQDFQTSENKNTDNEFILTFSKRIETFKKYKSDFTTNNEEINEDLNCNNEDIDTENNLELNTKNIEIETYNTDTYYEQQNLEESQYDEAYVNNDNIQYTEPGYYSYEVDLLARLMYAEALENNMLDNQYTGAVVMNRLDSGYWGTTIHEVIYSPGQYACTWNGSSKFNSTPPEYCYEIATALINGERYGVPKSVVYQAQFIQGEIFAIIGNTYYCHWNR